MSQPQYYPSLKRHANTGHTPQHTDDRWFLIEDHFDWQPPTNAGGRPSPPPRAGVLTQVRSQLIELSDALGWLDWEHLIADGTLRRFIPIKHEASSRPSRSWNMPARQCREVTRQRTGSRLPAQ